MKRIFTIGILILLLGVLQSPVLGAARQFKNGNDTVTKGQVISGDLYFNGDTLVVDGDIQGDLIVFANNLKVNGHIGGSLIGVITNQVEVNGIIERDLRVAAQEITVTGRIKRSLSAVAMQLNIHRAAVIDRGILAFVMGQTLLSGVINDKVEVNSQFETSVSGKIQGDLVLHGATPQWVKGAKVSGLVLDYSGGNIDPRKLKGISVGNFETRTESINPVLIQEVLFFNLVWFIGSILLTLVFYRLFPYTAWSISEPSAVIFKRNLIVGLIGAVGIPLSMILLFVTRVGLPIAIFLGIVYLLLLFFAGIPVNIWMGRLLFKSRLHPVLMIVLGSLTLLLINMLPGVGLISFIIGSGMIIRNIRPQIRETSGFDRKA